MGAKKNVTVDGGADEVKIVKEVVAEEVTVAETADDKQTKKVAKVTKASPRSPKYRAARALVDKSKFFSPTEAVELVKKVSYSHFAGTVSADLVLKEVNNQISVTFPHQTGKTLRVAIVDDELLKTIEAGKTDFDILLTQPSFMPKLVKLARVLGPKGLMPNPKNDTIVADPEKKKAELLGGKTILKTERKMPLLHATLGKTNDETSDLVANLDALLKAVSGKVLKVTISSTMSPSVKVVIEKV